MWENIIDRGLDDEVFNRSKKASVVDVSSVMFSGLPNTGYVNVVGTSTFNIASHIETMSRYYKVRILAWNIGKLIERSR